MNPPRPKPRSQLLFASTLILLAALAVILLLKDLSHRPAGPSRIEWPPAAPAKP